ncbi:MAG TPA: hypothetical protein VI299_29515, partial [Polyangiales bacterium]
LGRRAEAASAAREARAMVRSVADTILDAELRRSFSEDVEPCARALRLAAELAGDLPSSL